MAQNFLHIFVRGGTNSQFTSIQGRMLVNMMENLKSAKRILSSPVSCTFGEWWQKIVGKVRLMILRAAKAFYFFEISI